MVVLVMSDSNPYANSSSETSDAVESRVHRSLFPFILVGFIIGAAVPVGISLSIIYQESMYAATLPPGTASCGMGMLGSLVLIFFGSPISGLIGSLIGLTAWKLT